jgi:hypothetical protein
MRSRYTLFFILGALVVAATSVYSLFNQAMVDVRARLAGRGTTIETSFGTLEYAVKGEGKPMLTIHGARRRLRPGP